MGEGPAAVFFQEGSMNVGLSPEGGFGVPRRGIRVSQKGDSVSPEGGF